MRTKYNFAANASKLHRKVGELLSESPIFSNHLITQEYSANKVNPNSSSRYHYDWAIPKLKIVIECMGKQHYEPSTFGGIDYGKAVQNFNDTQSRDKIKKDNALYAGWTYITIKYDDKLTVDLLHTLYIEAVREAETYEELVQEVEKPKKTEYHKEQLAKAREYRKERYRQQKEWKKNNPKS